MTLLAKIHRDVKKKNSAMCIACASESEFNGSSGHGECKVCWVCWLLLATHLVTTCLSFLKDKAFPD